MKILLTAGGTSEKIDQVRSITNHSSGRLGVEIAKALANQPVEIDYITTTAALQPQKQPNLTIHLIDDTLSLFETMTSLMKEKQYTAVIHSMAVSDFTPQASLAQEEFIAALNQQLQEMPTKTFDAASFQQLLEKLEATQETAKKISSKTDHLLMVLKQNPKVIQQVRALQPDTILVGFKLLVGVTEDQLVQVATENLSKNQADFVLANDLESIHGEQHIGYLVGKQGIIGVAKSKAEIAQLICQTIFATQED